MNETRKGGPLVLDACTVLTLFAAGALQDIARLFTQGLAVPPQVESEAQYIYDAQDIMNRISVDLNPLKRKSLLKIVTVSSGAESELYVSLAHELDDGEATACAISFTRQWPLATDDRKTLRFAQTRLPKEAIWDTPELLHLWFDQLKMPLSRQRDILMGVSLAATFRPPRNHRLREWWDSLTQR